MKYFIQNHHYRLFITALLSTAFFVVHASADSIASDGSSTQTVLMSEVEWGPLNPARGDKGPRAGKLWGDRTESGASGFLVKFTEGFSSPSHIHNVTYKGMVISGLIHNDDPSAESMWLPAGSFWTQPAGEVHITAANAGNNLAYIEIEDGPYLVLPSEQAFDNGERPVNVDESNIVWLDAADIIWVDQPGTSVSANRAKVAFVWGSPQDDQLYGTLIKLPAGFSGEISSHGSHFRAVVIQGQPRYRTWGQTDPQPLEPGSYFGANEESVHHLSCEAETECIIYVRTDGKYDVTLS